jgi:hypothetical protein
MSRISPLSVVAAGLSLALYFGGCGAAFSQQIMVPEKRVAAATPNSQRAAPVRSSAHVYLLRGLMNIFSLGMDDLAAKIQARGITATLHNHSEWQQLSDDIAARYKAGNRGPIVLIGHSLGADAVMFMGEYLGRKGVPIALIVPFDGTNSYAATGNVARVMNLTQRDYAYIKRGPGFRGELQNVDVSHDSSIGHISIDKSARLHALVVNKIVGVVGGRSAPPITGSTASKPRSPLAADGNGPSSKPADPATSGSTTQAGSSSAPSPAAAASEPAATPAASVQAPAATSAQPAAQPERPGSGPL